MHDAYIALGANLGDPRMHINSAIAALGKLPQTRTLAVSSLYRSAPVGGPPQPNYLNACVHLHTSLAPRELLDALLSIEAAHGRERGVANAPRTLDLDLLLYDSRMIDQPGLLVPHPRMHMRAFVLLPLCEIAAHCEIPGHGCAQELLRALPQDGITRDAAG
jgi:2-amino-4-hydroxy-6-hydroxymethyldihydropteridine diphosphokinase